MPPVTFKTIADFAETMQGNPLPESPWLTVSQEMIDAFATATGDQQWIHVDPVRAAKESPLKKTIAHGFFSVTLLSKFLEEVLQINEVSMALNYGLNSVRFPHPVPVGSLLRLESTVTDISAYRGGVKVAFNCVVVIQGIRKPACVAEFITVLLR